MTREQNVRLHAHAYLVQGEHAAQLREQMRRLSCAFVCEKSEEAPCLSCAHCRKALAGIHPDVIVVEGSGKTGSIGVDQIRAIRASSAVLPGEAKGKVYLIERADLMTPQAQNALLKVLEEPPEWVAFVLGCSNLQALLATVRSRVQLVRLQDTQWAFDDQMMQKADEIVRSLRQSSPFSLMCALGTLAKTRQTLSDVLDLLLLALRDAMAGQNGLMLQDGELISRQLRRQLTIRQMLGIKDAIEQAEDMLRCNCHTGLLCQWLCIRFARAVRSNVD